MIHLLNFSVLCTTGRTTVRAKHESCPASICLTISSEWGIVNLEQQAMLQGMPASPEVTQGHMHLLFAMPLDICVWLQGAAQIDYITNLLALLVGTVTVRREPPLWCCAVPQATLGKPHRNRLAKSLIWVKVMHMTKHRPV